MKVIGKSQQGYLIAASEREIQELFGFDYGDKEWEAVKKAHERAPGNYSSGLVGLEINVSAAYSQLTWMRRRDSEFDCLVKSLRKTADEIQNSKPLFDLIIADKPSAAQ